MFEGNITRIIVVLALVCMLLSTISNIKYDIIVAPLLYSIAQVLVTPQRRQAAGGRAEKPSAAQIEDSRRYDVLVQHVQQPEQRPCLQQSLLRLSRVPVANTSPNAKRPSSLPRAPVSEKIQKFTVERAYCAVPIDESNQYWLLLILILARRSISLCTERTSCVSIALIERPTLILCCRTSRALLLIDTS